MPTRQCARLLPGAMLLILALGGCTTIPDSADLERKLDATTPKQAELKQVPFFPQEEYQCGPAALATVLQAHGLPTTPETLTNEVYLPQRRGSLQIELSAAARSRGMLVYPLVPDIAALLAEIAGGNPVLVFQNLGLAWFPQWHYAVVVGYDLEDRSLILRSGRIHRHRLAVSTFDRTWRRTGRWALVVVPPQRIPVTAAPRAFLRAAHALESSGQTGPALQAYRAAARHWRDEPLVLMALANAEYAAGNLANADDNLRALLRLQPDNADAWNNLAYVLAGRRCTAAARQAIGCALALQPDDANIRHSADELGNIHATEDSACATPDCPVPATP